MASSVLLDRLTPYPRRSSAWAGSMYEVKSVVHLSREARRSLREASNAWRVFLGSLAGSGLAVTVWWAEAAARLELAQAALMLRARERSTASELLRRSRSSRPPAVCTTRSESRRVTRVPWIFSFSGESGARVLGVMTCWA